MKYDLDMKGMKKIDKNGKNCMHWNVARMYFLELQRLYVFWTGNGRFRPARKSRSPSLGTCIDYIYNITWYVGSTRQQC